MLDGDFVQFLQALRLRNTIVDHDGVDVLHVGDADELVDGGVVALIAFERRIGGLPFSKPTEFGRFEIKVIESLPQTKILDCHAGAHPMVDGKTWILRLEFRHIGKANEVLAIDLHDADNRAFDVKFGCLLHFASFQQLKPV